MDARLVGVWLLFTLLLFLVEPLIVRRYVHHQSLSGNVMALMVLHGIHWMLLILSLITVLAAVAGSHWLILLP